MQSFEEFLERGRFQGYAYAYPHKTAYRELAQPVTMREAWANEDTSSLFLYMHIPFCEMRCGFCNLFTVAKPGDDERDRYLDVLRRQVDIARDALPDAHFARMAIGGGTPTQLDEAGLVRLFDLAEDALGVDLARTPISCEMSPDTATTAKLDILADRGVTRASIGVQSFYFAETKAVRRPQKPEVVDRALTDIRDHDFETFNIDLIYGMPGQTRETWLESIRRALEYAPDELYLYPLYVRPRTGLGNSPKAWDDHRFELYAAGRDHLLGLGWEQVSMRMFRRPCPSGVELPLYRCQEDGMVGLGAGARSYTSNLHYSTEYAVGRRGVQAILHDFMERDDQALSTIDYGFHLNNAEKRHRFVILSLLSNEGLDRTRYASLFDESVDDAFPGLQELVRLGYATDANDARLLQLTVDGMSLSDAIGPWLYSSRVNALSEEYELV